MSSDARAGASEPDDVLVAHATSLVQTRGDGLVHTVAAAARTTDGRIVTGLNLFHFTGGPCAELVVMANAAALGASGLDTIVAVGSGHRGVLAPCGRCRQVLLDRYPSTKVLVPGRDGTVAAVPVRDLVPYAFVWAEQRQDLPHDQPTPDDGPIEQGGPADP